MSQTQRKFWQWLTNAPRESQALTFLRVSTGLFFTYQGLQKLEAGTQFTQGLAKILQAWASNNPFPWYKAFLVQVAIPHATLFAQLITPSRVMKKSLMDTGHLSFEKAITSKSRI